MEVLEEASRDPNAIHLKPRVAKGIQNSTSVAVLRVEDDHATALAQVPRAPVDEAAYGFQVSPGMERMLERRPRIARIEWKVEADQIEDPTRQGAK